MGLHLPLFSTNSILDQCDELSSAASSTIEVCKRCCVAMNKVFAGIEQHVVKNKMLGL